MEYQLNNPSFKTIINYCDNLLANEKLIVFDFGHYNDLVLHIFKDEYFHPDKDRSLFNIVAISVFRNGKCVEDTGDIYIDDLNKELSRIYTND